ncbi:MAG: transglycosylase domain-containing protein [Chloroflexi bacterium]|nr:transglycosylase domain-containing protein [Chloroflexota bacterium]MDA1145040.1 transglycosylase domain-containing protein [Chloroflexota bacterium]
MSRARHSAMRRRIRARAELQSSAKRSKGRSKLLIILGGVFLFIALAGGATAGGTAIYGMNRYNEVADTVVPPEQLIAALPSGGARIYDRNGELLYEFVDEFTGLRRPVPIEEISQFLIDATVSVEDPTFYENNGLNTRGLARAAIENLTPYGGEFLEGSGGSSITQQLAKNVYIPLDERAERSVDRKIRETVIALELTKQYDKDQILSWYLNSISYGGIYTGIEAAAQGYFGKSAAQLNLAEASLLAGIPQSPALYYPFDHIDPLTGQLAIGSAPRIRQSQVLDLMVDADAITPAAAEAARSSSLTFKTNRFDIQAPHFVLGRVADELRARFGEKALVSAGLEVITTIDMNLQREAERIIEEQIVAGAESAGGFNGSLVGMDVQTGQILTYVGSRDYFREDIEGRNDNAVAPNSPGSTLKPFTFMTAFMQGWGTGTGIVDAPYTIIDAGSGAAFSPRDPIGTFQGPMTAASALGNSLNITAIKAIEFAGVDNTVSVLKQMGQTALDTEGGYGPALTLGGGEITLFDQVISYGVLAADGVMRGQEVVVSDIDPGERTLEPIALLQVTNAAGETLYKYEAPVERRVVAAEFPSLVTSILSDGTNQCLTYGVCHALSLPDGRPSAAKTGTSEPYDDSREIGETWTLGYTPHLVAGAWIGNANNDPMVGISSAGASLRSWKEYMVFASAYLELPPTPFTRAPGVVEREVCWPSGKLPSDICPQINRYKSLFGESVLPRSDEDLADFEDDWWQTVKIDTRTGLLARDNTPATFVKEDVRLVLPPDEVKDWGGGLQAWAASRGILSLLAPSEQESTGPQPVLVTSPAQSDLIQGTVQIRGTARSEDFLSYSVEWGRGSNPTSWVQLISATRQIANGPLAQWDTTFVPNGPYTILVLLQDAKLGIREYNVAVNVNNGETGIVDDLAPVVEIQSPIAEAAVSGEIQIIGTAGSFDLQDFVVEVGAGITPTEWVPIERRTTSVANSRLATWDTSALANGIYTIRVTVKDSIFGEAQAQVFVIVRNEDE